MEGFIMDFCQSVDLKQSSSMNHTTPCGCEGGYALQRKYLNLDLLMLLLVASETPEDLQLMILLLYRSYGIQY